MYIYIYIYIYMYIYKLKKACKLRNKPVKTIMFSFSAIPSLALPAAQMTTRTRTCSFPKFFMASTLYSGSGEAKVLKKLSSVPSMSPEKVEIFKSMEGWARESILPLLKPVEKSWHPADLLPDCTSDGFVEQVKELRERTKEIPDDLLVVLVGNMVTEEALPTYHSRINSIEIYHDETGIDNTPWAIWSRAWSAEENRHGDVLNKYLYLSGRIDMKQVEKTIQYLIGSGVDLGTGDNPYHFSIYTSFQERGTFISHGNTAKLALKHGDLKLAKICGAIASDEKRHETAYSRMVGKLFELDPNETMVALADMLRTKINMPGHLMYDGQDLNLFDHYFGDVASRIGMYTRMDYIKVLEHLVDLWKVEKLEGLTSEAQMAQDYVCGLPQRLRRMEERARVGADHQASVVPFSWIFNREV